jgi:mRNA-degrading endonuclease toxin of MazEF toxin-antitoxin module
MVEAGTLVDFDFGPRPHGDNRMEGPHPAVVVQGDKLNLLAGYSITIICPLTSKHRAAYTYVEIQPSEANGLEKVSYVKCEQVFTVPSASLRPSRGRLTDGEMNEIKARLKFVFDIKI